MGSSRLPGKVLADVAGRPLLGLMLERLVPLAFDASVSVVVATSDAPGDDPVAAVASAAGFPVVRGSETDVLGRFVTALDAHPADDVIRLTADCPLIDPVVVRDVLAHHRAADADYTSNTLVRTFPDGMDVEVVTADVLRAVAAATVHQGEREHVTPSVYRRPSTYLLAQHTCAEQAGAERWTIDRADDLDWLRATVARIDGVQGASWLTILRQVGRHAPVTDLHLQPVCLADPTERAPYERRWQIRQGAAAAGSASVLVDEGIGWLTVSAPLHRGDEIEALVREALKADLQVQDLRVGPREA